jgi:hypothetical protein
MAMAIPEFRPAFMPGHSSGPGEQRECRALE